jgi:hypothetical protein
MVTLIIYLLLGHICSYTSQNGLKYDSLNIPQDDPIKSNYITQLLIQLITYTNKYSNQSIIDEFIVKNTTECHDKLIDVIKGNDSLEIVNYSGKTISDTGLEDDCKSRNYSYVFLTYSLELPVFFNDSDYSNFYTFMGQKSFYLGLCLYRECTDFYSAFLDESQNAVFFDHLREKGINNLTLFEMDYLGNTTKEDNLLKNGYLKLVIVFFYIFLFYIILRCIVTFAGMILYDKGDRGGGLNNISHDFSLSASSDELIEKTNIAPKQPVKGIFYRLYKILTLNNFKLLSTLKNKYFDDTNLEFLCGVRMYLLFLITFSQNIYGISRLPHRDFGGYNFYTSFWYFFAKFASYSSECLIALNAIFFGYKLMNYHKYKSDGSLISYMKFYFNYLTRVAIFVMTFVFLRLFLREVSFYIGDLTIFDYFVDNFVNQKECITRPWIMLIPFYLQYFIPQGIEDKISGCFKLTNFILCEFYCYTFIMILFYILQKIKSKKLDFMVFLLNIANLVVLYFNFDHSAGRYYTYDDVLGEVMTFAIPHVFLIPYFLGFNVGITYFYYKDVIVSSISYSSDYMPFYYNFYFMKFLDTKSNAVKRWIICICLIMQFVISLNFYILLKIAGHMDNDNSTYNVLFEKNILLDILTIYQNKVFCIFFLLAVVTFLITNKDLAIKNFFSASIFITLNRIGFAFFCIQDSITYIFYAMYNIQIYSNIQNCLFVSFGLLIVITISSTLCFILWELPFRLTYKYLFADKKSKVRLK